jgi:hypothetical protein
MNTINEQLQIGVTPRNTNIVNSAYARSANNYQVQLGNEDPSLDYYNDTQAIDNMSNFNGWDSLEGDRDLGEEMADVEEYNEFFGVSYPPCAVADCKKCKNECKHTQGLKWGKGGKACYKGCRADEKAALMSRIDALSGGGETGAIKAGEVIDVVPEKAGMGAGAMVGIAVGGIALIGLVVFLIKRKK